MEEKYERYVGIDWATESHQVAVLDAEGKLLAERAVKHSGVGIAEFVEWLTQHCNGNVNGIAIAIEIPRGAIVESLVERGFPVYCINPKQLDRFRDRHSPAGAKDDRRDAFVLADSLRTDRNRFRQVKIDDPVVIELREVARVDEDLAVELGRLSNRLREQLLRYFPQALELCPAANLPWFWALIELLPTPQKAAHVRAATVGKVLKANRVNKLTGQAVLEVFRQPPVFVAPGTVEAATTHIRLLLPRLRIVHQQRSYCGTRMEKLLAQMNQLPVDDQQDDEKKQHRDVDILRSLPGVGRVVSATVFAEAASVLQERDYHTFRALAGVAPVTRQTGKQGKKGSGRTVFVLMRRACNKRLRNAVYHWARVSTQLDEATTAHYASLRQRGHKHGRALRGVADRLLRILFAMLRNGTLYDASRHNGGGTDSNTLPAAA